MLNRKYSANERLEACYYNLLLSPKLKFIGIIGTHGKWEVNNQITATAATDGINCYYNSDFVDSLEDNEMRFLVIHEQFHKLMKHVWTMHECWKRDPMLANMSADYAINPMIIDLDPSEKYIKMPTDSNGKVMGLIDPQFKNMAGVEIFWRLWEENEKGKEADSNMMGDSTSDGESNSYSKSIQKRMEHDQLDDHNFDDVPEENLEKAKNDLNRVIRDAKQIAGSGSEGFIKQLDKELALEVLTPWYEILKAFVRKYSRGRNKRSFRRFNRSTIASNLLLPSHYSQDMGKVVIAIDSSGSCWSDLPEFMKNVVKIAQATNPSAIKVLYWDEKIESEENYLPKDYRNMDKEFRPTGGGGTNPKCVYEYLNQTKEKISCVIFFTDGYFYGSDIGDWHKFNKPLLWAINEHGMKDFKPVKGNVINLKNRER